MSERPISVGDLVQIVRWPCCGRALGTVFVVVAFQKYESRACSGCDAPVPDGLHGKSAPDPVDGLPWAAPVGWLKRIPPLSELEGETRNEEVTVKFDMRIWATP